MWQTYLPEAKAAVARSRGNVDPILIAKALAIADRIMIRAKIGHRGLRRWRIARCLAAPYR
jgi:hypothetical protein